MALTQYYVDPAIAGDSGTGTIGDAFGDLQYALNTVTRDATNGDQFNIKAGTAEVLAASLTLATYGTPTQTAPLVLRGYTSAADDGGVGEINCNGASMWAATTYDYIALVDLHCHSFGNNNGIHLRNGVSIIRCEVDKGASTPSVKTMIFLGSTATIAGCNIHDPGSSYCIDIVSGWIVNNSILVGSACSHVVYNSQPGTSLTVTGNVIRCVATSTRGLQLSSSSVVFVTGNSICNTAAGTTTGLYIGNSTGRYAAVVMNNIISGWSGTGGCGIETAGTGSQPVMVGYNAFYNNTSNYELAESAIVDLSAGDVLLGADPFTDAANADFSLTTTAKAALRSLGWPASYLGAHASTDPHITIGAMQYGPAEAAADYPAEADVRLGVDYNSAANTGTLDLPAEADVQSGVTFDGATKTGTFAAPAVGDVQDGVTYGAAAEFTGTFAVPTEAQVEDGVGFGASGTEFTGSLVATGAADWTTAEKAQIRQALGVDGSKTATASGDINGIVDALAGLADENDVATAVAAAILVTPANKIDTGAGGAITTVTNVSSANVTEWKGSTAPAMTGDAYARLGAPAGASVSADIAAVKADTAAILVDTGTTLPTAIADLPTASEIDTELSGTHGDGSWEGGASGAGTVTWTYTLTSSVDDTPIADADVWVTTDAGGSNVIASGQTDQYGQVEFELDPGTIYVWRQKSGWNFSNPDTEVVV